MEFLTDKILPSGPTVNENATASCASAIFPVDDYEFRYISKRSEDRICIRFVVLCPVLFVLNRIDVYACVSKCASHETEWKKKKKKKKKNTTSSTLLV
jgi:hypothetical protein